MHQNTIFTQNENISRNKRAQPPPLTLFLVERGPLPTIYTPQVPPSHPGLGYAWGFEYAEWQKLITKLLLKLERQHNRLQNNVMRRAF